MDVCKVCGHKNPLEEANFCYYCGASLREDGNPEPETAKAAAVTVPSEETDVTQVKRPFSTMQWFGMFMLLRESVSHFPCGCSHRHVSVLPVRAVESRAACGV